MEEMMRAYENYTNALADASVTTEELEALYDEWVSLKVEAEGRD